MVNRTFYEREGVSTTDAVIDSNLELSDEREIDTLTLDLFPETEIIIGDEITFKDVEGNTIFVGICREVKFPDETSSSKKVKIRNYEINLSDRIVNDIFENYSLEGLIEEIVTRYSNLTFSTSFVSGITIPKYTSRNKSALEVIKDLLKRYKDLTYTVDINQQFNLFIKGERSSSFPIINGTNAIIQGWEQDSSKQVTRLQLKGDKEVTEESEKFSGTGSEETYTLSEIPSSIDVFVGGTRQDLTVDGQTTGDYTLNKRKKEFTISAPSGSDNIEVNYLFEIPIVLTHDADPSLITKYGIIEDELTKKWLNDMDNATDFAEDYVSAFSEPILRTKANIITTIDITSMRIGDLISVEDEFYEIDGETINQDFTISKISRTQEEGVMIEVGENRNRFVDYTKENNYNVRQLYEQETNSDIINTNQSVKSNVKITYSSETNDCFLRTFDEDTFYLLEDENATRNQMKEDGTGPIMRETGGYSDEPCFTTILIKEEGGAILLENGGKILVE